ncbi:hypothetical protein L1887_56121 [Cichorium endivia]|nr:hypothetical protein L1887_56121 [Cichorium endivia]
MGCPQAGCREHAGIIAETARAANHDRRDGISTRPIDSSGFGRRTNPHRSTPRVDRTDRLSPFHIRPGTHRRGPHIASLPTISRHSLTLFSKSFFIFPSRYLFAIGLTPVFSLGRNLPPYWGCIPKTTRLADSASWCDRVRARRGSHPLWRPLPGDLGPVRPLRTLLQTTIRTARPSDFQAGLIPVRSPLLRESL